MFKLIYKTSFDSNVWLAESRSEPENTQYIHYYQYRCPHLFQYSLMDQALATLSLIQGRSFVSCFQWSDDATVVEVT